MFFVGYQTQVSIYDSEGPPSKTGHIEYDLILIFKNDVIYDTYSQGYYCQTKNGSYCTEGAGAQEDRLQQ
jgi:hypothetical protein